MILYMATKKNYGKKPRRVTKSSRRYKKRSKRAGQDEYAPKKPSYSDLFSSHYNKAKQMGQDKYAQAKQMGKQHYATGMAYGQNKYSQAKQMGKQHYATGMAYGQNKYEQAKQMGQQHAKSMGSRTGIPGASTMSGMMANHYTNKVESMANKTMGGRKRKKSSRKSKRSRK